MPAQQPVGVEIERLAPAVRAQSRGQLDVDAGQIVSVATAVVTGARAHGGCTQLAVQTRGGQQNGPVFEHAMPTLLQAAPLPP